MMKSQLFYSTLRSATSIALSSVIIFLSISACGIASPLSSSQVLNPETEQPADTPDLTLGLTLGLTPRLTQAQLDEFTQFVQEEMAQDSIPGVAVAIIQDDDVVLLQGFGTSSKASPETAEKSKPNSNQVKVNEVKPSLNQFEYGTTSD